MPGVRIILCQLISGCLQQCIGAPKYQKAASIDAMQAIKKTPPGSFFVNTRYYFIQVEKWIMTAKAPSITVLVWQIFRLVVLLCQRVSPTNYPQTLFMFCHRLKPLVHDNNTSRSTAQPQSHFQPPQADITSEEAAFGTGFLVCAREVTALDYEHTSLDGNPQSTHLHSLANGSVIREDVPLEPQSTFNTLDRLEVSNLIDFHADAAPIPAQDSIDTLLDRHASGVGNFIDLHADAAPILAQDSIDTLLDRHASGVGNFIDLHADAAPIPAQDSIDTLLDCHASGVGNFIDLHADAAPIPAQDSIDTLLDCHASGVGNFIDFHADATPIVTRPSLGIPPSTFTTPDRPSMTFNLFDATSGEARDRSVGLSTECPNQTHPDGLANMSSSLSSEWVPLDDTLSPRSIIQTIHVVPNG
ncbi:unnamed protein product [Penicillium palitans]